VLTRSWTGVPNKVAGECTCTYRVRVRLGFGLGLLGCDDA